MLFEVLPLIFQVKTLQKEVENANSSAETYKALYEKANSQIEPPRNPYKDLEVEDPAEFRKVCVRYASEMVQDANLKATMQEIAATEAPFSKQVNFVELLANKGFKDEVKARDAFSQVVSVAKKLKNGEMGVPAGCGAPAPSNKNKEMKLNESFLEEMELSQGLKREIACLREELSTIENELSTAREELSKVKQRFSEEMEEEKHQMSVKNTDRMRNALKSQERILRAEFEQAMDQVIG